MNIDKEFKIQEFEKDREDFTSKGINILNFVYRKKREQPDMTLNFYDYAGEYYKKPEHFAIGEDMVYKKKQCAGEVPAEVILAYAYNYLGMYSPIAYPFFMSSYNPRGANFIYSPDGVITKDIKQIFPSAVKRGDVACHTFKGLYTDEKCEDITREGKLSRLKETVASIAFNNKDAGFDNSFWLKDSQTGQYTGIVSIDHGYSGRDSMYAEDKDAVMRWLYHKGEHGYNGMYYMEEDRATVLYYLKKLLMGNRVDGVQLSDSEIREVRFLINEIGKLNFKNISDDYASRYTYKCSPKFIQALEWSREDFCKELS